MELGYNFDTPAFDGVYMVIGTVANDDGHGLARWEHILTLARIVAIPRPSIPDDACMAKVAMVDHMEQMRLSMCTGLIVVCDDLVESRKKGVREPFVNLHDYKLIMQALTEGKAVLTTKPLCDNEVIAERAVTIESLDPDSADQLYYFAWDDYRAKFGKQAKEKPVLLGTGENPAIVGKNT